MAQAGYTPISLYYSTTAAAVPVNTNLVSGELAINITDEKLYFKNAAGVVKLLASNATSAPVLTFSAGTTGFTPSSATSGAITLAGTLNVANGGTGLTSLTAGYIPFGAGTSAFGNSSNLFFDSANARLGILTTSPQSDLHIARLGAAQSATARLQGNQGADGEVGVLNFSNRTDITGGYIIGSIAVNRSSDDNSGAMLFNTAASASTPSERMRITRTGDVGIGTSSPASKLQVVGSILATGSGSALRVNEDGSSTKVISIRSNFSSNGPAINVETADPLLLQTSNTERMRIASDGKVGIAVTDVRAVLQIGSGNGGGNVPTTSKLMFGANNSIVTFLSANDGVSTDGVISSYNTVYAFENAKINFDKPAGNLGQLSFWTQNGSGITERLRINNAGAFGLSGANYGTSGQVLTSGGSGATPTWTTVSGGGSQWTTSGTQIYYNSGDVGIGTATPTSFGKFAIRGGVNVAGVGVVSGHFSDASASSFNFIHSSGRVLAASDTALAFGTQNVEKMRITNTGDVGIGTSSPLAKFHIADGSNLYMGDAGGVGWSGNPIIRNPANSGYLILMNGSTGGVGLTAGGGSWTSISDERHKTNLVPIENGLSKVMTLRAVTGRYVVDNEGASRAFLIAQDVQKVLPEAVSIADDGRIMLSYTDTIPLLVAAIKELKAEFDAYKLSHP